MSTLIIQNNLSKSIEKFNGTITNFKLKLKNATNESIDAIKNKRRNQLKNYNISRKLQTSIRSKTYDNTQSILSNEINYAGVLNAPQRVKEILQPYFKGETILPRKGRALAVPLDAGQKGISLGSDVVVGMAKKRITLKKTITKTGATSSVRQKITPKLYEQKYNVKLYFMPFNRKNTIGFLYELRHVSASGRLVRRRNGRSSSETKKVLLFVLIKKVIRPKVFDTSTDSSLVERIFSENLQ